MVLAITAALVMCLGLLFAVPVTAALDWCYHEWLSFLAGVFFIAAGGALGVLSAVLGL